MRREILVAVCGSIGIFTLAIEAYAGCCKNIYSYSGGSGTFCAGPSSTICDEYAEDANPGKESTGSRAAVCTTWIQGSPANWYSGACNSPPIPITGWVKISENNGTCCWVRESQQASTNRGFNITKCDGVACEGEGGGGEG